MDAIQIVCALVALAIAILLDVISGNTGHTLICLAGIAFWAVITSYEYRKQCKEAEDRKNQYQRKLRAK